MRRMISILLSVILIFTLAVPAMAATVTQEASSTAIKAGEEVTVTVTLDEDVADIVMYQYSLYYNKSLFTMTGSTGSAVVSNPLSDEDGDYFMISFVDTTSEGVTISAGTLAALTFQAQADMTEEQAASFLLRQDYFWDTTYEDIQGISLENGTVNVTVSPAVPAAYTVTLPENPVGYTITPAAGSVSPVTEGGSYSFTVTVNNGYEGIPVVKANDTGLTAADGVYTIENIAADQVITVEGISLKANTYIIEASADVTASEGENVTVSVNVTENSNAEITSYNDYDVTLTYDPDALTYVSAVAAHSGAEITHDALAGTIRIVGHGEAKAYSDAVVTLTFTAEASGSHVVSISSAKIDNSGNAISLNAPNAAVSDRSTVVNVSYPVTLPENFTGDLTVLPGGEYQFTAPNEYYDITVTVGGVEITPDVDGLVYTIHGVNGDVVITASGKTYTVSKSGDNATFTGADTAQYGTDYSFTLAANTGYVVTEVSVRIGGTDVDYTLISGSYIISGNKITGDVTITVTTQQQAANTTQITFEGVDSSEVVGGLVQYATNGRDFTFELNEEDGYVYAAKLGEEELKPIDGIYTIPGPQINGTALIVSITKEVYSFTPEVKVSRYIQLNETVMWLVTATEGDNVLAYGEGNTMCWSNKYNAYCWLVVSANSEDVVKQEAAAAILPAAKDAVAVQISYDYDANQTGAVDINDAQLTYDMYQAKLYSGFDTVAMDKFLEADVNGDAVVNVEDAAAVVAQILK